MLKEYPRAEIAQHNTPASLWIIVDSLVYDLTAFAEMHPGGEFVLHDVAGKDATDVFYQLHRHDVLQKFGPKLLIGRVFNESPKVAGMGPTDFSTVPYAEPSSIRPGWKESPYYKESHKKLRIAMREFVNTYIRPEAVEHEESGERPSKELWKRMGDVGMLPLRLGPGKHLKGLKLFAGLKPEEVDYLWVCPEGVSSC